MIDGMEVWIILNTVAVGLHIEIQYLRTSILLDRLQIVCRVVIIITISILRVGFRVANAAIDLEHVLLF